MILASSSILCINYLEPCVVDVYAEYDNCEGSGFQDDPSSQLESDEGITFNLLFYLDLFTLNIQND